MSLQYTDGINLMGQSNMSALLQGLIANAIAPEVFVAGAAVGGARLANDTWLSLAEPWTRAAYYTSLIARHNGAKYKRLVSVFFQGESDTESDPLSLAHQAKVAAYHAFLAADLVATGGVLYEVIILPWNTSVGGGTGYTNVRAGLQAYVAASPSTRVAIDTASWGRSGDNVHLTPAQVATNAPTIIAAINAFLTRTAATEGGSSGGGGGGGSGTVTSVALSGGTTGLTVTGSPITTSGTMTLAGTLAIANGGTGATTASAARTALGLVIGTDVLAPNGSGASLTALNASAITSGTVPAANLGSGASISTKFLRGDNTWQTISGGGDLLAANNLSDLASAATARTNLGLVIGTNVLAPNGSGASLTALNASAITSGTVPAANLGSGASITTKFLRGDNTWQTISAGGDLLAANNLSDLASAATARTNLGLGDAATKTTSAGGNGVADSGKAALFGASGELLSTAALRVNKTGSTTIYATSSAVNLTAARAFTWPDSGGIYATQEWVGDTFLPLTGGATITTLGTITTGTWNGTTIGVAYGGTGATTAAAARTGLGIGENLVSILSGPEVSTAATTGRKAWFRVTRAFTITAADVSLDAVTAPTGSSLIGDIEKNGTSIYSTRPSIDAGEISSSTGVAGTLTTSPTSFAIGDIVGIWIDQIGSTVAGAGISMTIGTQY